MDITPLVQKGSLLITGYGAGGFTINGERHDGSLILLPEKIILWPATSFADISADELLAALKDAGVEILLLGTGEQHRHAAALSPAFKAAGIALDAMSTGAACRTYNVLMAESRLVAAALIAV